VGVLPLFPEPFQIQIIPHSSKSDLTYFATVVREPVIQSRIDCKGVEGTVHEPLISSHCTRIFLPSGIAQAVFGAAAQPAEAKLQLRLARCTSANFSIEERINWDSCQQERVTHVKVGGGEV
jgi:hypothetical protein